MAKFDLESGDYAANGARVAIIAARFNRHVVGPLLDGAVATLVEHGVSSDAIRVLRVPGAFELPLAARRVAEQGEVDAVICLGAVIRGGTPHFDYVCQACAHGIMRAGLDTGVPVIFGVLTTDDEAQAAARAGGAEGNKGAEAALAALETVNALGGFKAR